MIKEIAVFISGKTSLIIGDTLQVGHRTQDAPDRCSAILESGGGKPYFDLPDRIDKTIQIISRAKTYFTARTDAWEIFDALHGTAGWQISAVAPATQDYEAQVIEGISDPQYIGQDEKLRYEFSTNFIVKIKNK